MLYLILTVLYMLKIGNDALLPAQVCQLSLYCTFLASYHHRHENDTHIASSTSMKHFGAGYYCTISVLATSRSNTRQEKLNL
jgi:hypothetical protein